MSTLIFEPALTGHHLEYLHHYYLGALERPEEKYIFLVSRKFDNVKGEYEWAPADNISIHFIDEKYDSYFSPKNVYKLGWNTSRVLRDYVKLWHPDKVVLTMLMQFIPFICLLLPKSVRVRGIMYKIYLYEQSKMSRLRLLAEKFRFWVAARSKVVESIFVLNDEGSAKEFNRLYHTDKFRFIPDPVPNIDMDSVRNVRDEYAIPVENKMFLHFGGLDERKGTLDILNAIISSPRPLNNMTFVFAGKQKENLRTEFYSLLKEAEKKAQILVFDEFCSYDFLYNMCYSCDVVLMPYHITSLSSGVLGYSALFNKPVIGPADGLIGYLIRKFKLGHTLNVITPSCLLQSFDKNITSNGSRYSSTNSQLSFVKSILF